MVGERTGEIAGHRTERGREGLKEGMLGDKNCLLTVRESLLFHQIRGESRFISGCTIEARDTV